MKNIRIKFLVKLIASLCIVISFLGIGVNNHIFAADAEEDDDVFGGVLLTPVTRLITAFADGAMDILHSAALNQNSTIIRLDAKADTWWQYWGREVFATIAAIGIAALVVGFTLGTGGAAGVFFVIKTIATGVTIGAVAGGSWIVVGKMIDSTMMDDDICIPIFNLTPEEIFSNNIWLFDVNFFEPESEKNYKIQKDPEEIVLHKANGAIEGYNEGDNNLFYVAQTIYDSTNPISIEEAQSHNEISKLINDVNEKIESRGMKIEDSKHQLKIDKPKQKTDNSKTTWQLTIIDYEKTVVFHVVDKTEKSDYLSIKFYSDSTVTGGTSIIVNLTKITVQPQTSTEKEEVKTSIATDLRGAISKWYFTLRNLALLVLMLLLIYSGIRIVIGSTAGEKAKYKERLIDWLVGISLVFLMHYIMVFAVELNEKFVNLIDSSNGNQAIHRRIRLNTQNHIDEAEKHDELKDHIKTGEELELNDNKKYLVWTTNLMGGIRIDQQLVNEGTVNWIGYALCYVVLVVYTVIFAWTYLKRVVYMAFLTMIAPLVAMTYPLDKLTDGKAQAFNAWLKEYIFNLLIQPFHLLLYTVLVTSAFELVGQNSLYALVAIGFMTPAEKLLRKFFGFEKAQTPGLLGGAAGAALAMSGLQKIMALGDNSKNSEQEEESDKDDIKFSSSDAVSAKAVMASNQITDISDSSSGNEGDSGDGVQFDNLGGTRGTGLNIFSSAPRNINFGNTTMKTNGIDIAMGGANAPISGVVGDAGIRSANDGSAVEGGKVTEVRGKRRRIEGDGLIDRKKGQRGVILSAIGSYNRLQGQKMYKRLKKARPIRSLARGATGLFGGTLFGMAGLALGIASGDPSKAFQYTTAGAAGGFAVGKGVAGKVVDAASVDTKKLSEEISVAYYGEDYKNQKLKQEKEKLRRNEDYIMYLRKVFGVSRKGAIEILETTGADCLDSGITEIEDIAAQHRLVTEFMADQKNQELDLQEDEWAGRLLTGELNSEFGLNGDEFKATDEDKKRAEQEVDAKFADEQRKLDDDKASANKKFKEDLTKMKEEVSTQTEEELKKEDEDIRKEAKGNLEKDIRDMRQDEYSRQIDINVRYQEAREALDELLDDPNSGADLEQIRRKRAELETAYEKEKREAQERLERNINKALEGQVEVIKNKRRQEIKEGLEKAARAKIKDEKKKLDEELAQREKNLRQEKDELIEQKVAAIEKAKAKAYALGNEKIQRAIDAEIESFRKSVQDRDEEYQRRRKEAFEQAIVMKKFSDRTPDFSKMTEKKIQSYRDRFEAEMKDELKKQLKARGMTDAEAKKIAEARSGEAANQIIQGIIRYDTTKSELLEV